MEGSCCVRAWRSQGAWDKPDRIVSFRFSKAAGRTTLKAVRQLSGLRTDPEVKVARAF